MMVVRTRFILAVLCFGVAWSPTLSGQTFLGIAGAAALPTTQYAEQSELGIHGELKYGIHRFCDLWPVL